MFLSATKVSVNRVVFEGVEPFGGAKKRNIVFADPSKGTVYKSVTVAERNFLNSMSIINI